MRHVRKDTRRDAPQLRAPGDLRGRPSVGAVGVTWMSQRGAPEHRGTHAGRENERSSRDDVFAPVEGTALSPALADSNVEPMSLARLPDGHDGNNAATDWALTKTATPGLPNLP